MKLLRNPIVTGILAVVALAVVFYQAGGAKLLRARPKAPSATAIAPPTAPPAANPVATAANPARDNGSPATGINSNRESAMPSNRAVDREFAAANFKHWIRDSRLRDPFLLLQPAVEAVDTTAAETNSPVATWKLKAIWNQTGSRLAVINNGVYRVGDEIEGYKILRIENDEVWFQGQNRKERLGFETPQKAPAKNAATEPKTGADLRRRKHLLA